MRSRASLIVAASLVPLALASSAVWGADVVKANNTVAYVNGASWVGGIAPTQNDVAVWNASSNVSTMSIAGALAPGGLRIGNAPAGTIGMTNNTITVGRFGIDMSAATADLSLASFQPQTATGQTWRVADGRTLTITTNFLANTSGSTQNPGAAVNFSPSATGSIVLQAPTLNSGLGNPQTLNTNALIGNGVLGFAAYRGSDFAALNSSRQVVGGLSVVTYDTNASAIASNFTNPVNISVAYNTTTQAGTAFAFPAAGTTLTAPLGMRFGTKNPNGQPWVVDFGGGAAVPGKALSLGVNGLIVSPDIDTDVVFTNAAFGTGTRGSITLTGSAFSYIRNYSTTANLILGVPITGTGSRISQVGPGTVLVQQLVSTSGAPYYALEGTTIISGSGRLAGGIIVGGGTVFLNNSSNNLGITVHSGGTLGGTGNNAGTVTIGSNTTTGIALPGNLVPGFNGIGTLAMTGLTLTGTGSLVQLEVGGTGRDLVSVTGTGSIILNAGAKFGVVVAGSNTPYTTNTTLPVIRGGATLGIVGTGSTEIFSNGTAFIANPQLGSVYTFANTAGSLNLTIDTFASNNWSTDADGSWAVAGNWSGAAVPNAAKAFATIGNPGAVLTAPRSIALDGAQTAGTLRLTGAQPITLSAGAGGSLAFDNTAAQGELFVGSGNHTVAAPVTYSASAGLNVNVVGASDSINFASTLSGGALLKNGAGTLVVTGSVAPSSLSVLAGKLQIGDGGSSGSVSGNVALSPTTALTLNRSDNVSFGNTVTGASGSLIQAGTGTVTLTGGNSYGLTAGSGLFVQSGTAVLGSSSALPANAFANVSAGAELDLNANAPSALGGLLGSGVVTDRNASAGVTTIAFNNVLGTTFNGSLLQTGVRTLAITKANSGTQNLAGPITLSGDVTVTGGLLDAQTPLQPVTGSLVVTGSGAVTRFSASATSISATGNTRVGEFASITVAASGRVQISALNRTSSKASVLVTNSLTVSGGGFVDLGNSDLIVRGGTTPTDAIRDLVSNWYSTGTNVGLGASSASPNAAPYTTLAVFSNNAGGVPFFDAYDGVTSLTTSDTIVKFTYVGDTDLDGDLDGADLANVLEGYSLGLTGWQSGDVDHSGGLITASDVGAFLAAYNYFTANALPGLGNGTSSGGSSGAVPEPTSSLLIAVAGAGLLGRRRRA